MHTFKSTYSQYLGVHYALLFMFWGVVTMHYIIMNIIIHYSWTELLIVDFQGEKWKECGIN